MSRRFPKQLPAQRATPLQSVDVVYERKVTPVAWSGRMGCRDIRRLKDTIDSGANVARPAHPELGEMNGAGGLRRVTVAALGEGGGG